MDRRLFRRFKDRRQRRIGADLVVVSVAAEQASVKSYVSDFISRYAGQLGAYEISFGDTVFFIEQSENVFAQLIVAVFAGSRSDENIKVLARYAIRHGFSHLVLAKMRKQIGHVKNGIALILADADLDLFAVSFYNDSVKRERYRRPLILFDTAVIVGFEERHLAVLIERILLDIKAR